METGGSLAAPDSVRKLQTALHAKAKGSPDFRFYSLSDKVWRADVLEAAWQTVRRNGGAAGVDGETVQHVETQGVERWLGELARDLKEGSYRPGAVRQVLIPKKQAGKYRPLGIPCVRDRVAQTAALLILAPIFEADLQPEQYAYREGCSAQDAVKRVHRLLNTGHREVVDADLSNYFGEIPHAELMRSVARRVSDGRLLGWIKAWLEMPVEEDDGKGGKRRTNRARRERKGTPQGAPVSPLISNIYMRRFIVGWKVLGNARRFNAEIVNYADDFVVCGKAPADTMRGAVEDMMQRLRLPINVTKTRSMRVPDEPLEFLGYRIGRNYPPGYGPRLHRHAPEPEQCSERVPQDQRVDAPEVRTTRPGNGSETPEPGDDRLGELLPTGTSQSGLQGCRRACDQAAAPVAVPQAQGTGREVRALPGQAPVGRPGPCPPCAANGELSVGEGMISSESRVRETRMPGSMSGERKRGYGGD